MGCDRACAAYMEDEDEKGHTLFETRRSAKTSSHPHQSTAHSNQTSLQSTSADKTRDIKLGEVTTKANPTLHRGNYNFHPIQAPPMQHPNIVRDPNQLPLPLHANQPNMTGHHDQAYYGMPQPGSLPLRTRAAAANNSYPRPQQGSFNTPPNPPYVGGAPSTMPPYYTQMSSGPPPDSHAGPPHGPPVHAPFPPGQYPPGQHPSGQFTPNQHTSGQFPPNNHPPGQFPPNQHPPGQFPPNQHPSGQFPPNQHPSVQFPPNQHPSGHLPPNQFPHQFPHTQFPPNHFPPGQLPPNQFQSGHYAQGQFPHSQLPSGQVSGPSPNLSGHLQPRSPSYPIHPGSPPPLDHIYSTQQPASRSLYDRFHLGRDFDPITRTASAFDSRDTRSHMEPCDEEGYNSVSEAPPPRRSKHRRKSDFRGSAPIVPDEEEEEEPDYELAHPPSRPHPNNYRNQTDRKSRKDVSHDKHSSKSHTQAQEVVRSRGTSISHGSRHTGDGAKLDSSSNSHRRKTWYDNQTSAGSSGYENKLQQASCYLDDFGEPDKHPPLTAETLRRQQKRQDGSSRSTKSSASRDDSDYKKSVTTRTTRSGSGNEEKNMTIKVTGSVRVTVGGAQIECTDGGAIEISRDKASRDTIGKSIRDGSDRSSPDSDVRHAIENYDRHTHSDKSSRRTRINSQQRRLSEARRDLGDDYF
ncbi:BgTH12-00825 [Blumeria graminis f. sp. triticale]|uniref:BgTH12-00825 n=1 Tax=Blumeria graminis f. sp. triticale TaxID=1689686 RepID=A0A9W4DP09_BLUGR|nr:BgTH12-00825 [Blumeria graminis f. sp. triticale]